MILVMTTWRMRRRNEETAEEPLREQGLERQGCRSSRRPQRPQPRLVVSRQCSPRRRRCRAKRPLHQHRGQVTGGWTATRRRRIAQWIEMRMEMMQRRHSNTRGEAMPRLARAHAVGLPGRQACRWCPAGRHRRGAPQIRWRCLQLLLPPASQAAMDFTGRQSGRGLRTSPRLRRLRATVVAPLAPRPRRAAGGQMAVWWSRGSTWARQAHSIGHLRTGLHQHEPAIPSHRLRRPRRRQPRWRQPMQHRRCTPATIQLRCRHRGVHSRCCGSPL